MSTSGAGPPSPRGVQLHGASGLLSFADAALPGLRLPNGLFCFDRGPNDPTLRGESVRYSIMVLLGLLRRAGTGAPVSVDPDVLHRLIHTRRAQLGVGDLGLLLWADTRMGDVAAAKGTLADLERKSASPSALAPLEGMEAAWFVMGAVAARAGGLPAGLVVDRSMAQLRQRQSPRTPLFRHFGTGRLRARLPNFATQIYSLLALAEAARHDVASDARGRAERLAELLIRSRDADFGWPWLYHSEDGAVVERYEVYSVHQDAMAPMALLRLWRGHRRTGLRRRGGQRACSGASATTSSASTSTIAEFRFAHRSIRRKGLAQRARPLRQHRGCRSPVARRIDAGGVEINATCRPYHLGWILEAWSGRDDHWRTSVYRDDARARHEPRAPLRARHRRPGCRSHPRPGRSRSPIAAQPSQHVAVNAAKVVLAPSRTSTCATSSAAATS